MPSSLLAVLVVGAAILFAVIVTLVDELYHTADNDLMQLDTKQPDLFKEEEDAK